MKPEERSGWPGEGGAAKPLRPAERVLEAPELAPSQVEVQQRREAVAKSSV